MIVIAVQCDHGNRYSDAYIHIYVNMGQIQPQRSHTLITFTKEITTKLAEQHAPSQYSCFYNDQLTVAQLRSEIGLITRVTFNETNRAMSVRQAVKNSSLKSFPLTSITEAKWRTERCSKTHHRPVLVKSTRTSQGSVQGRSQKFILGGYNFFTARHYTRIY